MENDLDPKIPIEDCVGAGEYDQQEWGGEEPMKETYLFWSEIREDLWWG